MELLTLDIFEFKVCMGKSDGTAAGKALSLNVLTLVQSLTLNMSEHCQEWSLRTARYPPHPPSQVSRVWGGNIWGAVSVWLGFAPSLPVCREGSLGSFGSPLGVWDWDIWAGQHEHWMLRNSLGKKSVPLWENSVPLLQKNSGSIQLSLKVPGGVDRVTFLSLGWMITIHLPWVPNHLEVSWKTANLPDQSLTKAV